MHHPTLKTLLAAAVIGTGGSVAMAQQDAELEVRQPAQDRAVITIDREQQAGMQDRDHEKKQKELSGTVISLETYLREGESAARQASATQHTGPKALLTEDGDLYVILDRSPSQRDGLARYDDPQTGQHRAQAGQAQTPRPQRDLEDSRVSIDDRTDTDDRIAGADRDQLGADRSPAPVRDRMGTGRSDMSTVERQRQSEQFGEAVRQGDDQQATGLTDRDAEDREVYGMAAPQQDQQQRLRVGQDATIVGAVYERNGVRGIQIDEVR